MPSQQRGLSPHLKWAQGSDKAFDYYVLEPDSDDGADLTGATDVTFQMRKRGATTDVIDATSGASLQQANPGILRFDWTDEDTSTFDGVYSVLFWYTLGGVTEPVSAGTLNFVHPSEIKTTE